MNDIRLFQNTVSGRLDKALAQLAPDFSRARLQALIAEGAVTVGGKPVTAPAHKLKGGEDIAIILPELREAAPQAESIPLAVVYEDKHLLVINKPAGLVVHPAAGNATGTLVNALLAHCGDSLSGIGGVRRPGIVHRLDKDTSGLMVVAKSDAAHQGLSAQFADHSLRRRYSALVWGVPMPLSGTIDAAIGRSPRNRKKMAVRDAAVLRQNFYGEDVEAEEDEFGEPLPAAPLNGKHAVTHYSVIDAFGLIASHVSCVLETGRTHQIRVHLAHIGHSVIGDPVYGAAKGFQKKFDVWAQKALAVGGQTPPTAATLIPRQALHAAAIDFIHPHSGKAMHFEAPLPDDMEALLTMFAST